MAGRNFLFVPGPTNTPDRILRAMHVAMEDHRSSSFPALAAPVLEDLKKIFKTTQARRTSSPPSGTGAWEAVALQHAEPGRPRPGGPLRHVQPPLDRHGPAAGPPGGRARRRVGRGRADRALPRGARGRQEPRDQGRPLHPQRDRDRRHQRRRRDAEGAERRQASRAADGRRRELDRRASTSAWTSGAWTAPSPARRRASCCRRASASLAVSPKAAALYDSAKLPRVFFDLRRHEEGQRHRLLPLHAGAADAVRPARVARDAVRGRARQRLRPPSSAGRGHAGGDQGLGARALRPAAEVELRYRERHPGAGRRQRRAR